MGGVTEELRGTVATVRDALLRRVRGVYGGAVEEGRNYTGGLPGNCCEVRNPRTIVE